MAISFRCPHCGSRVQVSWLSPGELAACRSCGAQVPVPRETEPLAADEIRSRDLSRQASQASLRVARALSWLGLIPLASLVISLASLLGLGSLPEHLVALGWILMMAPAPIANVLLGMGVGRLVATRPFVWGVGMSVAGWVVGFFGIVVLDGIADAVLPSYGGGGQGLGIAIGFPLIAGLVTSPIAGISSRWGARRRR